MEIVNHTSKPLKSDEVVDLAVGGEAQTALARHREAIEELVAARAALLRLEAAVRPPSALALRVDVASWLPEIADQIARIEAVVT